jgi:acetolactate synthase-1/2/3 large subunit
MHMRHEAGAAFAAVEHSLAARRPVLVFTTAGPGLTNALTGMVAARWEGAHVVYVSAATSAANRGRVATQETGPSAFAGLHFSATIEHPAQLAPAVAQLAVGFARPGGFVAHIALPIDVQRLPCARPPELERHLVPGCAPGVIAAHAARFSNEAPLIWLGYGARHAAAPIRELVERLGARVMCSPRAKGIVPEDHPRFLGVTGLGGHTRVDEQLAADRPRYTLVLGTRMGESTSFWSPELAPSRSFIHVDVDATAFGAAYPDVPTEGVLADIGAYVTDLLGALGRTPTLPIPSAITITEDPLPVGVPRSQPRREGPVRPQYLLEELQRLAIDAGDAWVMAESGNSFCWATHHLKFREPGRYRVSTGFGSMGHATTGVVGAAVARGKKAIALVGDGAMMMLNELHSAVQYRADALWIVLNDACYLM